MSTINEKASCISSQTRTTFVAVAMAQFLRIINLGIYNSSTLLDVQWTRTKRQATWSPTHSTGWISMNQEPHGKQHRDLV